MNMTCPIRLFLHPLTYSCLYKPFTIISILNLEIKLITSFIKKLYGLYYEKFQSDIQFQYLKQSFIFKTIAFEKRKGQAKMFIFPFVILKMHFSS